MRNRGPNKCQRTDLRETFRDSQRVGGCVAFSQAILLWSPAGHPEEHHPTRTPSLGCLPRGSAEGHSAAAGRRKEKASALRWKAVRVLADAPRTPGEPGGRPHRLRPAQAQGARGIGQGCGQGAWRRRRPRAAGRRAAHRTRSLHTVRAATFQKTATTRPYLNPHLGTNGWEGRGSGPRASGDGTHCCSGCLR